MSRLQAVGIRRSKDVCLYTCQCGHACMFVQSRYEYHWADGTVIKKPIKCSAPRYTDYLMSWVQDQLDDETLFPSKIGNLNWLYMYSNCVGGGGFRGKCASCFSGGWLYYIQNVKCASEVVSYKAVVCYSHYLQCPHTCRCMFEGGCTSFQACMGNPNAQLNHKGGV